MSQPEDAILNELRSARITASPELRVRVRELAAAAPPAAPLRRELPWRRLSLVLVPACVAVALAGALAAGLATSGKKSVGEALRREAAPARTVPSAQPDTSLAPLHAKAVSGSSGAGLPTTPGRAQLYEAEVTLKVKDLSAATKRALRLTRSFNGYVRSVEYGSGAERGSAYLVLRVPVGSVQDAIVSFSALGEILDQHVSIQDVQPQLDKRFRAMQTLRDAIAKLQAQLESPTLSAEERKTLENELVSSRRQLLVLQRAQARLQRQTSFATVSIDLRSTDKAVAPPHDPGRIGRALDRSGSILLDEVKVVVYVLIVGAPLLALAALGLGALRLYRRRTATRLLSAP
jgi:uncharacterized protein DUF4349